MVIKMKRTHVMPFGVFNANTVYDTSCTPELTEGQAKTFINCGSAIDVTPKEVDIDESAENT